MVLVASAPARHVSEPAPGGSGPAPRGSAATSPVLRVPAALPDDSCELNLSRHAASDRDAAWSPDGLRIAFASDRDGGWKIYIMVADGSDPTPLTRGHDDRRPRWSPDGSRIAFDADRNGRRHIYIIAAREGGTELAEDDSQTLGSGDWEDIAPSWSPDGRQIAFSSDRAGDMDIYAVEVASRKVRRLTKHPAADLFPVWSPNDGEIAFFSQRDGNDEVYLVGTQPAVPGESVLRLTKNDANDFVPSWSPDGTRLVFASTRLEGRRAQLFVMDAGGFSVRQLTDELGRATEPSWSPDGGRIAFTSDRDGDDEVYVRNLRCSP